MSERCTKNRCVYWSPYLMKCKVDIDLEEKKKAGQIGKEAFICMRNPDKKVKDYCKLKVEE